MSDASLRTERRLRKALSEIIVSQGSKQGRINVGTLCEYANITRTTFYAHFTDFDSFYDISVNYVLEKFSDQCIDYLLAGREAARAVTRRSALKLCREDFLLIEALFKYRYHSLITKETLGFIFLRFFDRRYELFSSEGLDSKTSELNFFLIGYLSAMQECFSAFESKKTYRALMYSFDIADKIGLNVKAK